MHVNDAVHQRRSIRAFSNKPVENRIVEKLLLDAGRAPSGGNIQPWKVHVVVEDSLRRLTEQTLVSFDASPEGEDKDHDAYPKNLAEPYRERRHLVGHQMYNLIGVHRSDRASKIKHVRRTFTFFNAPVGMLITIDRKMEPIQWTDVGMFIQTLMLLAEERGLGTCTLGFWSFFPQTIRRVLDLGDNQIIVCGLALGHPDNEAIINTVKSERAPLKETVFFHD